MIKWFAYIVLLLMLAPCLSFANKKSMPYAFLTDHDLQLSAINNALTDTTTLKNTKTDDKKKIKEIAKARRQPKPEKIVTDAPPAAPKVKPKRQRRPEGLERPPEIPRRNGN